METDSPRLACLVNFLPPPEISGGNGKRLPVDKVVGCPPVRDLGSRLARKAKEGQETSDQLNWSQLYPKAACIAFDRTRNGSIPKKLDRGIGGNL